MSISKSKRYEVLRRCNFSCYYCGLPSSVSALHVDHVIPRRCGGTDDPWNLVASCQDCNLGKSDRMPDRELIDRVRDDWRIHDEAARATWPCTVCGMPLPWWPETIDDGPADRCEPCDVAVCDAFVAGRKSVTNA